DSRSRHSRRDLFGRSFESRSRKLKIHCREKAPAGLRCSRTEITQRPHLSRVATSGVADLASFPKKKNPARAGRGSIAFWRNSQTALRGSGGDLRSRPNSP